MNIIEIFNILYFSYILGIRGKSNFQLHETIYVHIGGSCGNLSLRIKQIMKGRIKKKIEYNKSSS